MANSLAPLVMKDGRITINDGAGSPLSLALDYWDGDFSVSGVKKSMQDVQVFSSNGAPYAARQIGRAESLEFSFTAHYMGNIGDGSTAQIGDVVWRLGAWASATSTLATNLSDVFCVKLTFSGERTDLGASADDALILSYCHLTGAIQQGNQGKIAITGQAFLIGSQSLSVNGNWIT